jgi:hypothetical protein
VTWELIGHTFSSSHHESSLYAIAEATAMPLESLSRLSKHLNAVIIDRHYTLTNA